jgi:hypothetical protein
MIRLKWHGALPDTNMDELGLTVIQDIQSGLWGLERPSELIFHTVFLSKSYDGPCVTVWGVEGDDEQFHCEYQEDPEFVNGDGEPLK